MEKTELTYNIKIYLAGDIEIIKQTCRQYCHKIGLCITINPTLFIYTGGEEYGVEIGMINYPKFPDTNTNLLNKAKELATLCRESAYQDSYLILTSDTTIWNSLREKN